MSDADAVSHVIGAWNADDPQQLPYQCRIAGYWNGWSVPSFGRAEMDRLVRDMETGPEIDRLFWHGDLLAHQPYDATIANLIHPDADGRYLLDIGWCFHQVSSPEPGDTFTVRRGVTSVLLPSNLGFPPGTLRHWVGTSTIGTTLLASDGLVRAHVFYGPITQLHERFQTLHDALNALARVTRHRGVIIEGP